MIGVESAKTVSRLGPSRSSGSFFILTLKHPMLVLKPIDGAWIPAHVTGAPGAG